jgi:oxygen-independent coproporphyrinogen-3 oxidase
MHKTTQQSYSIYIHVPFCRQACSYCDFYFVTRQELIPDYTRALLEDIRRTAIPFRDGMASEINTGNPTLTSVYFGGGTPSRLPASIITRILETIHEHHSLDAVKEITLEANPDDLTTLQQVRDLKEAGITRLSMGVQSFDPALLTFMNRAHTAEDAKKSLGFIQQAGFNTHTVDLIYGNPGQSLQQLESDIKQFLQWNPPHISAYALTIEPGTRLGKARDLGRLTEPDDQDVARHMTLVTDMLGEAGLQRYEVSNFARPGHEAIHNSSYWNHTPYLGVGPGSHSLQLVSNNAGRVREATRWSAPADLRAYIRHMNEVNKSAEADPERLFIHEKEYLSGTELAEERILMGLRTREGLHPDELRQRYNYELNDSQYSYIALMRKEGYIEPLEHIRLTEKGYAIADRITLEIASRGVESPR